MRAVWGDRKLMERSWIQSSRLLLVSSRTALPFSVSRGVRTSCEERADLRLVEARFQTP